MKNYKNYKIVLYFHLNLRVTLLETTSPAAPGTAGDGSTKEDGGTDPIDDSASGRKLASVAARFASAALRVFGI